VSDYTGETLDTLEALAHFDHKRIPGIIEELRRRAMEETKAAEQAKISYHAQDALCQLGRIERLLGKCVMMRGDGAET
jgi:hypothetical protein